MFGIKFNSIALSVKNDECLTIFFINVNALFYEIIVLVMSLNGLKPSKYNTLLMFNISVNSKKIIMHSFNTSKKNHIVFRVFFLFDTLDHNKYDTCNQSSRCIVRS